MLTTFVIGVLVSISTEAITWVNKKLVGTVLAGKAAWFLAALVALIGASVKVLYFNGAPATMSDFLIDIGTIWTVAQVFFIFVIEFFGYDVQPTNATQ